MFKPISDSFGESRVIHTDDNGETLIYRSKSDNKLSYVTNHFKKQDSINKILPRIIGLHHSGYKYFEAFYVENSQLYMVFKHTEMPRADQYFKNNSVDLSDIIRISDNLFSEIRLMCNLPVFILRSILHYSNICIGDHCKISIRHGILDYTEKYSDENEVKLMGSILKKLFANIKDIPEPIQKFLDKCHEGKFSSIAKTHDAFREVVKAYIRSIGGKEDKVPWSYVAVDRKLIRALSPEPKWVLKTKRISGFAVLFIMILGIAFLTYGFVAGLKPPTSNDDSKTVSLESLEADIRAEDGQYSSDENQSVNNSTPTAVEAYSIEMSSEDEDDTLPDTHPIESPTESTENNQPASSVHFTASQDDSEEYTLYTVKQGDWLIKISREFYGTDKLYTNIAEYNNLNIDDELMPGQVLKIPVIN